MCSKIIHDHFGCFDVVCFSLSQSEALSLARTSGSGICGINQIGRIQFIKKHFSETLVNACQRIKCLRNLVLAWENFLQYLRLCASPNYTALVRTVGTKKWGKDRAWRCLECFCGGDRTCHYGWEIGQNLHGRWNVLGFPVEKLERTYTQGV